MANEKDSMIEVVVTVADAHLRAISKVVDGLKDAGLEGSNTLKGAGVITGKVAHGKLAALKKVTGVHAVEASGGVQLPPPDSEIQ